MSFNVKYQNAVPTLGENPNLWHNRRLRYKAHKYISVHSRALIS